VELLSCGVAKLWSCGIDELLIYGVAYYVVVRRV